MTDARYENTLVMPWPLRYGLAALFPVLAGLYAWQFAPAGSGGFLLIFATITGAYMAMNIGANDVANNVGPSVGSRAMTMGAAIALAAVGETLGALIAGGDVVGTIKSGIIDPTLITDQREFIWLMAGALLAGALWLNLATWMGAPVSTTHSIVGGVLGAGLAAGGMSIANWPVMGAIVSSWVISPVLGGTLAAATLFIIKRTITYRPDMLQAASKSVPWLVGLMAWAFTTYLVVKGIKKIWATGFLEASLIGLAVAVVVMLLTRIRIKKQIQNLSNTKESVNSLFTVPLIFAAGLLSFAHGANDVANAVGPLAAIYEAVRAGVVATKAGLPLWILAIGGLGLAVGLALFGPKLIRTVGSEITELDKSRAFCIAIAAAVTVIIASQLGLPVSSTHTALGGIFGVGFLREYLKTRYAGQLHQILDKHEGEERERIKAFLTDFNQADVEDMRALLKQAKSQETDIPLSRSERKRLKKIYRQELVKRQHLYKIVAAWVITVPVSGLLAAGLYYMLRGIMI
jgi:PiT family inorganic phosphate transporter